MAAMSLFHSEAGTDWLVRAANLDVHQARIATAANANRSVRPSPVGLSDSLPGGDFSHRAAVHASLRLGDLDGSVQHSIHGSGQQQRLNLRIARYRSRSDVVEAVQPVVAEFVQEGIA